ncbi:MAG: peptidoglycan-binding protein LysM [Cyanobacteria bacterium RYN_339]|nr:peptidoglycan-binding protein LysM [Cyanobacteria bacterium RYN_339]
MVRGPRIGGAGPGQQPGRPVSGMYAVKAGDTLQRIARSVYGDPNRWRDIFEANVESFAGPDMLYPGQLIRIPTRSRPEPAARPDLPGSPDREAKAARFVATARRFVGQPFRWGGGHGARAHEHPGPVDCSGLIAQAARMAGLKLEGSAAELQRLGRGVPMSDLRAGDLVFQGSPALDVAISLGWGRVLHASRKAGKVVEADLGEVASFDNARRVV